MKDKFKVVYIPADVSKEIEEWDIDLPKDKEEQLGCLTTRLRQHFKTTGSSSAAGNELFRQEILKQLPKGANVTDEMMNMMMQMDSLVDSVPLQVNSAANKYIGVNMYVDDRGTSKGLEVNARASAVAQTCGKMLEVRGDAFIGRVYDNDDDFERKDFILSDLSAESEWVQIARRSTSSPNNSAYKVALDGKSGASIKDKCGSNLCTNKGTLRCARCKAMLYCSAPCQRAHWKIHKPDCKKK